MLYSIQSHVLRMHPNLTEIQLPFFNKSKGHYYAWFERIQNVKLASQILISKLFNICVMEKDF